jgi:glucokinase
VLRSLLDRFGYAEIEQVVSGMGLMNLHRVTHQAPCLANAGDDLRAFSDKPSPFREMLDAIPVKVILNDEAGLLGAAVYAAGMGSLSNRVTW